MLNISTTTIRAELTPAQRIAARASRLNNTTRLALENYLQSLDNEWAVDTAHYIMREPMEFNNWQVISEGLITALNNDYCQINRLLASQNID